MMSAAEQYCSGVDAHEPEITEYTVKFQRWIRDLRESVEKTESKKELQSTGWSAIHVWKTTSTFLDVEEDGNRPIKQKGG